MWVPYNQPGVGTEKQGFSQSSRETVQVLGVKELSRENLLKDREPATQAGGIQLRWAKVEWVAGAEAGAGQQEASAGGE